MDCPSGHVDGPWGHKRPFTVALGGCFAIEGVPQPGVQNERVDHRLFRKDRGLLKTPVVLGFADEISHGYESCRGIDAGIVGILRRIVLPARIHAQFLHRIHICRHGKRCAQAESYHLRRIVLAQTQRSCHDSPFVLHHVQSANLDGVDAAFLLGGRSGGDGDLGGGPVRRRLGKPAHAGTSRQTRRMRGYIWAMLNDQRYRYRHGFHSLLKTMERRRFEGARL